MSPDLVPWLAALAFLLGIFALVLEVFLLPGFGIAGMAGIILLGWGILLLSVDVTSTLKSLVVALILSIVLFMLGIKLLSGINFWQRITLGVRQYKEAGYTAPGEEAGRFIGLEGSAVTPLRPAGIVEIDGQRLDVVSEGEFVAAGAKVKVVKVEGTRIVVRPV